MRAVVFSLAIKQRLAYNRASNTKVERWRLKAGCSFGLFEALNRKEALNGPERALKCG
jgi:hypothetical protein